MIPPCSAGVKTRHGYEKGLKKTKVSPRVRYNRVAREARVFLEEKGRLHWIGRVFFRPVTVRGERSGAKR